MYKKEIDSFFHELKQYHHNSFYIEQKNKSGGKYKNYNDENNEDDSKRQDITKKEIVPYFSHVIKQVSNIKIKNNICNLVGCDKKFSIFKRWKYKCILCKKKYCKKHIVKINLLSKNKTTFENVILCQRCYIVDKYIDDVYDGGIATFKLKTIKNILTCNGLNIVNPMHFSDIIPKEFNYKWFKEYGNESRKIINIRRVSIIGNNYIYNTTDIKPKFYFNQKDYFKNNSSEYYNNICLTEHLFIENPKKKDYIRLSKSQLEKIVKIYNAMMKINESKIKNNKIRKRISYNWLLTRQIKDIFPTTLDEELNNDIKQKITPSPPKIEYHQKKYEIQNNKNIEKVDTVENIDIINKNVNKRQSLYPQIYPLYQKSNKINTYQSSNTIYPSAPPPYHNTYTTNYNDIKIHESDLLINDEENELQIQREKEQQLLQIRKQEEQQRQLREQEEQERQLREQEEQERQLREQEEQQRQLREQEKQQRQLREQEEQEEQRRRLKEQEEQRQRLKEQEEKQRRIIEEQRRRLKEQEEKQRRIIEEQRRIREKQKLLEEQKRIEKQLQLQIHEDQRRLEERLRLQKEREQEEKRFEEQRKEKKK